MQILFFTAFLMAAIYLWYKEQLLWCLLCFLLSFSFFDGENNRKLGNV